MNYIKHTNLKKVRGWMSALMLFFVSTVPAVVQTAENSGIPAQAYKNFFFGVLLILLAAVIVGILGKVINIYQLTNKMSGKYNPLAANNFQAVLLLIALPIFLYGVYWSYVNHGGMAWRDAVTEHGKRIDTMFIITTIICTIVLVLMHILLFTFSYKYRMRLKRKAFFYPHNNAIEKVWTIIPAIVLTILVLFGFFTWRSITNVPEELQKSAIQIEVMGEQFAWTVRYPGRDGEFGPRNYRLTTPLNPYGIDFNDPSSFDDLLGGEIVIPVNKAVRFHIISKDILHSFYIPDFRVQINAVPGMTTYFQFTPTVTTQEMRDRMDDQEYNFVMLCNKICGSSHFNMQKRVRVVTEEEYQEWLNQQTYFFNEDVQKEFAARNQQEVEEEVSTSNLTAYNNL
ncbi:MAG TPA: cytochrome c oxidase subunit II [Sphingobacteriaceae bacterium]|nr:cytochrome c oxidase subunit II [Sphingobacteriaceae bacterium]